MSPTRRPTPGVVEWELSWFADRIAMLLRDGVQGTPVRFNLAVPPSAAPVRWQQEVRHVIGAVLRASVTDEFMRHHPWGTEKALAAALSQTRIAGDRHGELAGIVDTFLQKMASGQELVAQRFPDAPPSAVEVGEMLYLAKYATHHWLVPRALMPTFGVSPDGWNELKAAVDRKQVQCEAGWHGVDTEDPLRWHDAEDGPVEVCLVCQEPDLPKQPRVKFLALYPLVWTETVVFLKALGYLRVGPDPVTAMAAWRAGLTVTETATATAALPREAVFPVERVEAVAEWRTQLEALAALRGHLAPA